MPADANSRLDATRFRPRLALFARVTALLGVVLALALPLRSGEIEFVIWAAILCLPYLVFMVMPNSEKSLAWGRSLAWLGSTQALGLSIFVLWARWDNLAGDDWELASFIVLFLAIQVTQLVLLHRAYPGGPALARTLPIGVGYYVLAALFIWWDVSGIYDTSPLPNESAAIGSLRTISEAAEVYSVNHESIGFPPNLSSFGPAAASGKANQDAAGLVDEILACANPPCVKKGYGFEYHVVVKDGKGVQYSVSARPIKYQRTGIRSFLIDESAVIRFTSEDRAATLKDPTIN